MVFWSKIKSLLRINVKFTRLVQLLALKLWFTYAIILYRPWSTLHDSSFANGKEEEVEGGEKTDNLGRLTRGRKVREGKRVDVASEKKNCFRALTTGQNSEGPPPSSRLLTYASIHLLCCAIVRVLCGSAFCPLRRSPPAPLNPPRPLFSALLSLCPFGLSHTFVSSPTFHLLQGGGGGGREGEEKRGGNTPLLPPQDKKLFGVPRGDNTLP